MTSASSRSFLYAFSITWAQRVGVTQKATTSFPGEWRLTTHAPSHHLRHAHQHGRQTAQGKRACPWRPLAAGTLKPVSAEVDALALRQRRLVQTASPPLTFSSMLFSVQKRNTCTSFF
jgi:hypothetical protein